MIDLTKIDQVMAEELARQHKKLAKQYKKLAKQYEDDIDDDYEEDDELDGEEMHYACGGEGDSDVYMSDGMWIRPDGSIYEM